MATASSLAPKRKSLSIEAEGGDDADFTESKSSSETPAAPRAKPTPKKAKSKAATAKEFPFELSDKRRATVRTFGGKVLIDIREFYTDAASGEEKPGKKGIALNPEQWSALKALANDIDEAIAELS